MARTQAKVLVTIWSDDEWRETPSSAQRLYLLLLSQSRLNLSGCLDLMPARWANCAPDTTTDDIERDIAELERRRYIAVDRETGELVVRSFTEHDLAAGALNKNLIKGFWSAWAGILSATLRKVVVDALPDVVWSKSNGSTPPAAELMRSEPQLELPLQPQSEPSVAVTSTVTASVTDTTTTPVTVVAAPNGDPPTSGGGVMKQAARLLAEAEADRRGKAIASRAGYVNSRIQPLYDDNERTWRALLERDPSLTAEQLADPQGCAQKAEQAAIRERALAAERETQARIAAYQSAERAAPPPRPANLRSSA